MIPNQWYVVLESKEVKVKNPVGTIRFGEKLAFWRDTNKEIHCIADKCCHRGAALSIGKIVQDHLECPFHGMQYDSSGKVVIIPANGASQLVPARFNVKSYEVREAHGFVWVWYGSAQEKYPKIPFFEDIESKFPYKTLKDHWPVHYSRAIENQLDVVHVPFVHYNTIGKGQGKIIDGPIVKISHIADALEESVCVFNREEDGTPAKKPEVLEFDEKRNYLHFRFPHIWQNKILEQMRIFVAFVPIDDCNTLLYMRYYHKFVKIPVISDLICTMGLLFGKRVLHQDKRVVLTQLPIKSTHKMGEKLIQGDLPIIHYRRIRDMLIKNKGNVKEINES